MGEFGMVNRCKVDNSEMCSTCSDMKECLAFSDAQALIQDIDQPIRIKLKRWITSSERVSALEIYKFIQPDEPSFTKWVIEFVTVFNLKVLDDYVPMDGDYLFSPTFAFMLATNGGSEMAMRYKIIGNNMVCQAIESMFPNKSPIEIIHHGIAVQSGEDFLQRELDPEK